MESTKQAIKILQDAAEVVATEGKGKGSASDALTTIYNAISHLMKSNLEGSSEFYLTRWQSSQTSGGKQ